MKTLACLMLGALALAACSKRGELKPDEAPVAEPTPHAALPSPTPTPQLRASKDRGSYVVAKGDNLWNIAGKRQVLGDSFHWPLLYKQNRDQIIDPDIIEPEWRLDFRRSYSAEEKAEAVEIASERPPYVPHTQPMPMKMEKY